MSHAEMLAALDRRLDALLSGTANFVDLTDDSPEALELEQLLSAARLTIQVLDEPLSPATRARHIRMLEAAAACRDCRPGRHLGRGPDATSDAAPDTAPDAAAVAIRSPDRSGSRKPTASVVGQGSFEAKPRNVVRGMYVVPWRR